MFFVMQRVRMMLVVSSDQMLDVSSGEVETRSKKTLFVYLLTKTDESA